MEKKSNFSEWPAGFCVYSWDKSELLVKKVRNDHVHQQLLASLFLKMILSYDFFHSLKFETQIWQDAHGCFSAGHSEQFGFFLSLSIMQTNRYVSKFIEYQKNYVSFSYTLFMSKWFMDAPRLIQGYDLDSNLAE